MTVLSGDAWCGGACESFVNTLPLHYGTGLVKTLRLEWAFWHLVDVVDKLCDMDHVHGDDKVM